MIRIAHLARSVVWTMAVLLLAACAVPATPTPVPTIALVRPSPTPTGALRPAATGTPTVRRSISTPIAPSNPTATPGPRQFDDVNSASLLALLFPGLKLTPRGDEFKVNDDPNWTTWVNSRAEGRFTQSAATELAIIVANDAPHIRPADIEKSAPWGSFLAIFSKQDSQLILSQKAFLFPTAISPLAFDVKIDRVVDFDHDDQDELLIATNASRMNTTSTAAFLYQWNDVAFVEVWSAPVGEDNTGAINQKEYRISDSQIQFSDVNADGIDEIIVDTTRVDYAQDSQGLADLNHESARRVERRAFRWGGKSFVSDPARSTPLPPLPTPVP